MTVRDDLLARVDIVDVVSRYVSIRRAGKNWMGLCPFHKEKSPSFTVAEDKQIFKCFGCGKGGGAINFVMEIERIDYRDAVKELARQVNFDLTPYERNPEITEKRQQDREKLKLLNKRIQEFFVSQFPGSVAETYIRDKRKLTDVTIQSFGVGYAPDSYVTMIEYAKTKGFSTEDLQQAGLISQGHNGAMPFFRHRVTFPIYDHIGNIVGFGGRALEADQNPKYLNTTETALYEKSHLLFGLDKARNQIKEHGFLVVVEGYMDVIALHQYGIPLGVATCGTALTADHIKLLKRHTENSVLMFDSDQAGVEATMRALKVAYQADYYPRAFALPEGYKDVDEWLTTGGAQTLPSVIFEGSTDAFSLVLHRASLGVDLLNPVLRKKLQNQLFEIIQHIEDYGVLMVYLEQIGVKLRLGAPEMKKEFMSRLKQQKGPARVRNEQSSQHHEEPEIGTLVAGLLADEYRKQLADVQTIETLVGSVRTIGALFPEGQGIPTLSNEELGPIQLRRDRACEGMALDKKTQTVHGILLKFSHELIKGVLKQPGLSGEKKQDVMKMMQTMH